MAVTSCSNYGLLTALANSSSLSCQCPAGTGNDDCHDLRCTSAITPQLKRGAFSPVLAGSSGALGCGSQCSNDWIGVDCNVCQANDACGAGNVCARGSSWTWTQSYLNCDVVNPTLQSVFPGTTTLTISKLVNSTFSLSPTIAAVNSTTARVYYSPNHTTPVAEQFYCSAEGCKQTNSTTTAGTVDWECDTNLKCTCIPGTQFCGGGFLDLSSTINTITGNLGVSCAGEHCSFKTSILVTLFGSSGLGLSSCKSGECTSPLAINLLYSALSPTVEPSTRLAGGVIAGLAVLGVAVASLVALIIFACYRQRKLRRADYSNDVFKEKKSIGLRWQNVGYTLPIQNGASSFFSRMSDDGRYKSANQGRILLDNLSGEIKGGKLLAVLGTTGAGKSTFVELLAGKKKVGVQRGTIEIISSAGSDSKVVIGHVDQDDILCATATCREALMFAAELKLKEEISLGEKAERVDVIIAQLGLQHVADSRIGSRERRGISGGERRRLSIGLELIASPAILVLDEPTSGLDSASALKVMQVLRDLASPEHQTTIITTIHQPSSRIYSLFDSVLVLGLGGREVFYGDAKTAMAKLAEQGAPCPDGWNPADHLLELASDVPYSSSFTSSSIEESEKEVEFGSSTSTNRPALATTRSTSKRSNVENTTIDMAPYAVTASVVTATQMKKPITTLLTQFEVLAHREIRILRRDWSLIIMHNVVSVIVGLFVGGIYYKTGDSIGGFQSRIGSLFFLGSLLAFSSLSALSNLASVKPLFLRERSGAYYTPVAWFLSRVLFDLVPLRIFPTIVMGSIVYWMVGLSPYIDRFFKFLLILVEFNIATTLWNLFLAAAIDDSGVAILVSAVSNLVFMAYAGFFVSIANVPAVLRWVQWLDPLKYLLEALSINEVTSGLLIVDTVAGVPVSVSASLILLSLFGFDTDAYYRDVLILLGFIIGFSIFVVMTVGFKLREIR